MRLEGSISQFLINKRIRERVSTHLSSWMFQTDCYRALAMTLSNEDFRNADVKESVIMASIQAEQKQLSEEDIDEIYRLFESFEESPEADDVYIFGIIEDFIKERTYWKGAEYLRLQKLEEAQQCFNKATHFTLDKKEYVNLANKKVIKQQIKEDYPEDGKFLRSSFGLINNNTLYKGMRRGDVMCYTAPPGVGKTSMLCQEAAALIDQGYKVGYAVIGDNRENDIFLKVCGSLSNTNFQEIIENPDQYLDTYGDLLQNINAIEYAAGVSTVSEILSDFKNIKDKEGLDVLIVDYDANIAMEHESMYLSGGLIYSALKAFAQLNWVAVMVAAQPKMEFYSRETMPLECVSESGKKQHAIDLLVTLNCNQDCRNVGTLHLAKVRRGSTGMIARVSLELETSTIREISEKEYNELIQHSKTVDPHDQEEEDFSLEAL